MARDVRTEQCGEEREDLKREDVIRRSEQSSGGWHVVYHATTVDVERRVPGYSYVVGQIGRLHGVLILGHSRGSWGVISGLVIACTWGVAGVT